MKDLFRELAPISAAAWSEIEEEATRTLKATLAARRLVDFEGPLGWDASAIGLGRTAAVDDPAGKGAEARLRRVQPLVEIRMPFELDRAELEAVARGAKNADLDPVRDAARRAAFVEDHAVFNGYEGAGIGGIMSAAAERGCRVTEDYTDYVGVVVDAIYKLRTAGVGGPYAIALGPRCYTGLSTTMFGGYPVIDHLKRLLDGPIVSAPAIDGALVLSLRGGDFEFSVGQDFSIGYLGHTAETVRLYLQESCTFRVLSPEAAVPLTYGD